LMPQGPLVRVVCDRFGPDRLSVAVVTKQLPVGADRAGPRLPALPLPRIGGRRTERLPSPCWLVLTGVLADPFPSFVPQRGQFAPGVTGLPIPDQPEPARPPPRRLARPWVRRV